MLKATFLKEFAQKYLLLDLVQTFVKFLNGERGLDIFPCATLHMRDPLQSAFKFNLTSVTLNTQFSAIFKFSVNVLVSFCAKIQIKCRARVKEIS